MRLFKFALILAVSAFGFVVNGGAQEKTATTSEDVQDKVAEEEQEETVEVSVNDGSMKFQAPKSWEKVEPKFSMIEAEFHMKSDDEEGNGRMTIMASGGGVDGNIQRWFGQFKQEDGGDTEEVAKVKEVEIDGMKVHMVDITGTYMGGPGSSGASQDDYRMLAAIIETEGQADYFIKLYGPAAIVDLHADRFTKFVKSMNEKKDD